MKSSETDTQPDWPPQASATTLPEGTRQHGSTGQEWQVRNGQWTRLTTPKVVERRYTEAEWRDIDDLRKNWHSFCDADPFEGGDTFTERMEARGFIRLRAVRKADLEESFAAERGIEPGGHVWELTAKGERALDKR